MAREIPSHPNGGRSKTQGVRVAVAVIILVAVATSGCSRCPVCCSCRRCCRRRSSRRPSDLAESPQLCACRCYFRRRSTRRPGFLAERAGSVVLVLPAPLQLQRDFIASPLFVGAIKQMRFRQLYHESEVLVFELQLLGGAR